MTLPSYKKKRGEEEEETIIVLKEDLRLSMGMWGWEEVYLEIKFNKESAPVPISCQTSGIMSFLLFVFPSNGYSRSSTTIYEVNDY